MAAPEGYTKLGNVGYADKGVYSADATYNKYNAVYHEGSTYVALKDNLHGVTPADGANWRYMAKGFTEASADAITVIDTSGIIDGTKNKKTILQTFLDKVGDFIINKAVTNDALMLKLADYVAKTDIVQVESTATNKVPSSAYLKQVKDSIDSNLGKSVSLDILFSDDGWTTPAVYNSRVKNVTGGYKEVGGICYINIFGTVNAPDINTTCLIFQNIPPSLHDMIPLVANCPRPLNAYISTSGMLNFSMPASSASGLNFRVMGCYPIL